MEAVSDREGAFDMKNSSSFLDRNDCILAVIDLQTRLLNVIPDRVSVISNTKKILGFASIVGMPVLLTEQVKLGPTADEIIAHLTSYNPIIKESFDAALVPDFANSLKETGRKTVLVLGVECHICVMQTVLNLLGDYRVHLVSDACASRAGTDMEAAVARMKDAGAIITTTEMAIYEILKVAGTDEFRKTLPLIK